MDFPNYAVGSTINKLTFLSYDALLKNGTKIPSRNGDCLALNDFTYYLTNPRSRHLCLSGRTSNIFQLIGETLWVLSGTNSITDYLETLLPRAPQYSDDGKTWRAGYGARLFAGNQLPDVVEYFRRDGKMTRRAAISIFDPNLDTFTKLKEVYQQEDTKDFSCNNLLYFNVDTSGRFNLRVTNRSNDAVFGMGINLTEFSIIHEMVFEKVREMYPEVVLGTTSIYSNNFHGYEFTIQQVRDVTSLEQDFGQENKIELGVICSITEFKEFMEEYVGTVYDLTSSPTEYLEKLFDSYSNVVTNDGMMRKYIEMTTHYFAAKNGFVEQLDITTYPEDLKRSIVDSKFRKFSVIS